MDAIFWVRLIQVVFIIGVGALAAHLGFRFFMFSLITILALSVMVLLCLKFTDVLSQIITLWISPTISRPVIVLSICSVCVICAIRASRFVERFTESITAPANQALGAGFGLTISFLIVALFM